MAFSFTFKLILSNYGGMVTWLFFILKDDLIQYTTEWNASSRPSNFGVEKQLFQPMIESLKRLQWAVPALYESFSISLIFRSSELQRFKLALACSNFSPFRPSRQSVLNFLNGQFQLCMEVYHPLQCSGTMPVKKDLNLLSPVEFFFLQKVSIL